MRRTKVLKDSIYNFFNFNIAQKAASLSYYSLITLTGTLVLFMSLFGYILGDPSIVEQILEQVGTLFGENVEKVVSFFLQTAERGQHAVAGITGVIIVGFAATTGLNDVQNSLTRIFGIETSISVKQYIKKRAVSFSLLLLISFLFVLVLYFSWFFRFLLSHTSFLPQKLLIGFFNNVLIIAFSAGIFYILFESVTGTTIRNTILIESSLLTAILFFIGKTVVEWYLTWSGFVNFYGPASLLVAGLIWIYYNSCIFYFGGCYARALHDNQNL